MFSKALIIAALASATLARVFTTAPVASTTFSGGKPATIRWQDDGSAPSLREFGAASISIYVGNAQQQTRLQVINASVDVSTVSSLEFTPDPTIGPNSAEYFIRYESLALRDPTQPQFPALAFSAKFTLNEMTGTFSPAIIAQIAGQSTAPLGTQTVATTIRTTAPTAAAATTTTPKPTTAATSASTTPKPTNGASSLKFGWGGVGLAALIGASMF